MISRPLLDVGLALLLGSASAAQAPADQPQDASTRLHAAWIKEVLDLDVPGAVRDYEAIAADTRPMNLERWIAIARLAELQRAGVPGLKPVALAEAPAPIQAAVAPLRPLEATKLLLQLTQEPSLVMQSLLTEEGRIPDLRPITDAAQRWVRGQHGPSFSERQLQRLRTMGGRQRQPDQARNGQAFDVLRVELQGKQDQANALRGVYFADWKTTPLKGEPAKLLARTITNLDAWIAEPNLSAGSRQALKNLREAIELRGTTDTANMLALLSRLPVIGERLLAEPAPR